jgi:hypothetical protein
MVILAVVTGALSFFNYFWQANYSLPVLPQTASVIAQAVLMILTLAAAVGYRGRRSRPSYDGGHYRVWTFRFAVIMISMLGNAAVLVVLALFRFGIIAAL